MGWDIKTSRHHSVLRSGAIAITAMAASVSMAAESSTSTLREEFTSPSMSARPGAFWPWLNGNVDRQRIVYELDQIKEKGMGGAEIWDVAANHKAEFVPAGPEFLGPESAANIRFALAEGKKRGLRMGMITSSGWNAGGTWVSPDWASKMLLTTSTVVTGGAPLQQKLPFPAVPEHCPVGENGLPVFYRDVAVLAMPDAADNTVTATKAVINLTDMLQPDGTLSWGAPAGNWRITRFVCTNTGQILIVPSPNSKGLFIDFLDPEATRRHLKTIMDKLEITPENAAESGLAYLEVDSMELHEGNPWTDNFSGWFKKNVGYDLTPWLPALAGMVVQDKAATDAFLYDYRKAVSDLLIHSHYETGTAFLEEYGIEYVAEAGGPGPPIWNTCPVDALKALGNVTVPRGEFWIQHRNMFLIKEVSSAAHIYGKSIVDAESFTTWRRYQDSPFVLKQSADRAFAEGLNHLTIHTFAHSPDAAGLPGRTYHAGVDINPNTTWWPFARPFFDYMARCSAMLRQGLPVADVLWYYGDQAPDFFPAHHDVPEKPRLPGLGRGYDFDVINSDVIQHRLDVRDGRFVLPEGTSYRVLAFPDDAAIPLEVLEKLAAFVDKGGVILGNPRQVSPNLFQRDAETSAIVELTVKLWGDSPTTGVRTVGAGRVYAGLTLDEVLKAEKIQPDFHVTNPAQVPAIDYIHRATPSEEIYFVRNTTGDAQQAKVEFRVQDKSLELWDPATGKMTKSPYVNNGNGTAAVWLDLPQGQATFLVFGAAGDGASLPMLTSQTLQIPVTMPWSVTFSDGVAVPEPITMHRMESWTRSKDPRLKYFSGIGTYTTTVSVEASTLADASSVHLSLGKVGEVAEVSVNGTVAGIAWQPPFQVDLKNLLKAGDNTLEVRVANMWHNRLVGDSRTTETARVTSTNLRLPDPKEKLLPSGLLGPVEIIVKK